MSTERFNAMIWVVEDRARCLVSDYGSARAALEYNENNNMISEWADNLAPIYTRRIEAERTTAQEHDPELWAIAVDALSVLDGGGDSREILAEWYALRLYQALSNLAESESDSND